MEDLSEGGIWKGKEEVREGTCRLHAPLPNRAPFAAERVQAAETLIPVVLVIGEIRKASTTAGKYVCKTTYSASI